MSIVKKIVEEKLKERKSALKEYENTFGNKSRETGELEAKIKTALVEIQELEAALAFNRILGKDGDS